MKTSPDGLHVGNTVLPVEREVLSRAGGEVDLGVRPENLEITEGEGIEVEVDTVEELGADAYVYGHTDIDGQEQIITLRTVGYTAPEKGAVIRVAPQTERMHLFHAETGERLNG